MPTTQSVLLLGATGRTGRRVLQQLLDRDVPVRAIVRSARRLPPGVAGAPNLELVEASVGSLGEEELARHLRGCRAVVSCLGHVISVKGIFGPPRDLVAGATARLCRAVAALRPASPVKFILMSSVSVHRPEGLDTVRGGFQRAFMRVLCALLPPAGDNQRAADFLHRELGTSDPFFRWAVVRPDALLEGDVIEYTLHEGLVSSLFAPRSTRMANVAHFMCELVTNPEVWDQWSGKSPVILDAASDGAAPRTVAH
jgi:uncharacterized protein YbjT (DUF2867 family)